MSERVLIGGLFLVVAVLALAFLLGWFDEAHGTSAITRIDRRLMPLRTNPVRLSACGVPRGSEMMVQAHARGGWRSPPTPLRWGVKYARSGCGLPRRSRG